MKEIGSLLLIKIKKQKVRKKSHIHDSSFAEKTVLV